MSSGIYFILSKPDMNTYAVTVTYGNRFQFTSKLLKRLLEMGVHKVIIVDNASITESKEQLAALANDTNKAVLIPLSKNLGSAGGFKVGLEFAHRQHDCETIWLLDDDNLPQNTALHALLETYHGLGENCCLVSLRKDRVPYRKINSRVDVKRKFRPYNGFAGFNIFHGIVKKFLFNWRREKLQLIPIPYGPYGGMFFHKQLLDVIGYPNEKMFLYLDDHEFSHRVIKAGLSVYLDRTSIVDDMETSWHGLKKYRIFKKFMLLIHGDGLKSYYTMRNLMYFEKKYYINNKLEYEINRFVFKAVYYTLCHLHKKPDRIKMFEKACEDINGLD
jgi:GT2 family glycosyltransferase